MPPTNADLAAAFAVVAREASVPDPLNAELDELATDPHADAAAEERELDRLALLDQFGYDQERVHTAKRLGVRVAILDRDVKRRRSARSCETAVGGADGGKPTQRDALIECAADAELWHDGDGEAFATFPMRKHREHHRARSKAFRTWLAYRFHARHGGGVSAQAEEEALRTIEARARFEGMTHAPALRISECDDALWLDLADEQWRAVRIDADGWCVKPDPAARFVRPRGMLALPEPSEGGAIDALRPFLNVASNDDFILVGAWLVGAFMPSGPYPVLVLGGEQGSAKSTTARVLRSLVDPNAAPIRSAPRDEDDLIVAARGGHVVALDNLSTVASWLADATCRLATGAGFGKRRLYSDGDEVLFAGARPVILNGIPDLATRPDLADRAIVVALPAIPDSARRAERDFWAEFKQATPTILGAVLDAVVVALRRLPATRIARPPRMADFANWIVAAEPALPWARGAFLRAYAANRAGAIEATLDADPVAEAVRALVAAGPWKGRATDLLAALVQRMPEAVTRSPDWPRDATRLSGRLRRLAPALRRTGVSVVIGKSGGRRVVQIRTAAPDSVLSDPCDPDVRWDARDAESPSRSGPVDGETDHACETSKEW